MIFKWLPFEEPPGVFKSLSIKANFLSTIKMKSFVYVSHHEIGVSIDCVVF